jgi:hypothetical protein
MAVRFIVIHTARLNSKPAGLKTTVLMAAVVVLVLELILPDLKGHEAITRLTASAVLCMLQSIVPHRLWIVSLLEMKLMLQVQTFIRTVEQQSTMIHTSATAVR